MTADAGAAVLADRLEERMTLRLDRPLGVVGRKLAPGVAVRNHLLEDPAIARFPPRARGRRGAKGGDRRRLGLVELARHVAGDDILVLRLGAGRLLVGHFLGRSLRPRGRLLCGGGVADEHRAGCKQGKAKPAGAGRHSRNVAGRSEHDVPEGKD